MYVHTHTYVYTHTSICKIFSYSSHLRFRLFSLYQIPIQERTGQETRQAMVLDQIQALRRPWKFSLCLGTLWWAWSLQGFPWTPPRSPAHPTTDILSCSSELLPTGSTLRLPVPAPDWFVSLWVLCVPWAVWCLRHTQVLDGTQAQVQEKSWWRFLMFARDWSVLRAPALPCEHSQCKSECVQHDWHPGISPPLCWWHFPNKLILFLVHLSSTD